MNSAALKLEKVQDLAQKVLSEESIQEMGIPSDQICILKLDNQTVGPLWIADIKENFEEDDELYDTTSIKMLGQKNWMPIYEHAYFQRRKPQLVSSDQLLNTDYTDKSFKIRQGHHELGPLSFAEVHDAVDKGTVTLDTHFSIDDGETWQQLHTIEGLNRRDNTPVPSLPLPIEEKITKKSKIEIKEYRRETSGQSKENDAVAGLAFVGPYGKVEKPIAKEEQTFAVPDPLAPPPTKSSWGTWLLITVLLMVAGGATAYLFYDTTPKQPKTIQKNTNPRANRAPAKARKSSSITGSIYKKRQNDITTTKPAGSFKNSAVYKHNEQKRNFKKNRKRLQDSVVDNGDDPYNDRPDDGPYDEPAADYTDDPYSRPAGSPNKGPDTDGYDDDPYADEARNNDGPKDDPYDDPYPN